MAVSLLWGSFYWRDVTEGIVLWKYVQHVSKYVMYNILFIHIHMHMVCIYNIYIYIYILLYYICTEYHALTVRQIVCMCVIDSFATPNPQVVDGYRFCLIDACRSTLIHPLLSMCYLLWMQSIYECHALSHHSLVLQVCCDGKDSSFFFNSLASPGQQF